MLTPTFVFLAAMLQGQGSGLPHTTFATDLGGWTSISETGKLSLTKDVVMGKSPGSLKFDYNIAQGQMAAIMLDTSQAPLGKMKSLRFWVRPDHDTSFGVFLQEVDGGRYVAVASARKDTWQMVVLNPNDFTLTDGPDDPQDQNGKLDLGLVGGVGIGDFKQMLAQAGEELVALFHVQKGPHTFYMSDFKMEETSVPDSWSKTEKEVKLDTLDRPQAGWIFAGQTALSVVRDAPFIGNALKMEYKVDGKSIAAMFKSLVPGSLSGMGQIEFSVAAASACKLIVQVEERGGGKYNAMVDVAGGSASKVMVLPFSEFGEADDSNDDNEKLDLGQIKQILILDLSGMQEQKEKSNTLWVGPIVAKPLDKSG